MLVLRFHDGMSFARLSIVVPALSAGVGTADYAASADSDVASAKCPSARIRSAMVSPASWSSLYWVSNSRCREENKGPVTFQ